MYARNAPKPYLNHNNQQKQTDMEFQAKVAGLGNPDY
jgi:hypothetical protein